jgi:hypothetical protein
MRPARGGIPVDYITHNLFGIAIYGAQKKTDMDIKKKIALLATSVSFRLLEIIVPKGI